jgi:transglutaminase-like putative cysteine protease
MRLHVHHSTVYRYESAVARSTQYLRLTPRDSSRQRVIRWDLRVPVPATRSTDPYGNVLHVLSAEVPHRELLIEVEGVVEVDDTPLEDADGLPPMIFLRPSSLADADTVMRAFAHDESAEEVNLPNCDRAWRLMERLRQRMAFISGSTDTCTTAAEAFAAGQGVCQDFSHVMLGCLRELGIPARYASGYLLTDREGHVASHAWVEFWTGAQWSGLDVANGVAADGRHLKLATGLDYMDACPVRGVRSGGGNEQMEARALVRLADQ